ncbi:aromatic amino acid ammonia-lyase [Caldivirga maquilingensis]|uniref:Histidine ammonia-lyase n=1 Tax=Caldivirga maquilingensis (strain ATCC 700844 / DSM 13496 / JCM 10307 / IC-167) TaxID=397948 RepID=A8M9E8_CALMQ|nr:aromatic amino acid ammonia-lyase [Caldivirga maquilingensis]ABW02367.1 Histidine ammonia-lyase [Caldivirga maquilingensis IC-167]
MTVEIGERINLVDVVNVARNHEEVKVSERALNLMNKSLDVLEKAVNSGIKIYGVNTGLGDLHNVTVNPEDVARYSLEMLIDHSMGVGDYAPDDWVRATMLIRAHQLSLGYSGIRGRIIERLIQFLNLNITPLVPKYGSVGASGDLAPLAHIALALLGKGLVKYRNEVMNSAEVFKALGLDELRLGYKEALSLINGTSYSAALASLGIWDAYTLIRAAMAIIILMIEASRASIRPLSIEVNSIKLHYGEVEVARIIQESLSDSANVNTSGRVQDPYSIRCIPQVIGPIMDALSWSLRNIMNEVNSVSDNPVIINDNVYSTCHFHGQYLALSTDLLNTSLSTLGNLLERQIAQLMRREINNTSNYLANGPWRIGLMLTQYAAAALTARLRELASPSIIHNIPTSGLQEDVNSMSVNSAIKLHEVNSLMKWLISLLAYVSYSVINANNGCVNCGKVSMHVYDIINRYVTGSQSHHEAVAKLTNSINELASLINLKIDHLA